VEKVREVGSNKSLQCISYLMGLCQNTTMYWTKIMYLPLIIYKKGNWDTPRDTLVDAEKKSLQNPARGLPLQGSRPNPTGSFHPFLSFSYRSLTFFLIFFSIMYKYPSTFPIYIPFEVFHHSGK
jgi:hypothetical protein